MRRGAALFLIVYLVALAAVVEQATAAARRAFPIPVSFVPQALCVHSGWHWSSTRPAARSRPEYRLAGRWWFRTSHVPPNRWANNGEAAWDEVNGYGGGMQFLVGTWNNAAALSHGLLARAASQSDIAARSPAEQIYAAYLIVRADGDWREWPNTARACGLL